MPDTLPSILRLAGSLEGHLCASGLPVQSGSFIAASTLFPIDVTDLIAVYRRTSNASRSQSQVVPARLWSPHPCLLYLLGRGSKFALLPPETPSKGRFQSCNADLHTNAVIPLSKVHTLRATPEVAIYFEIFCESGLLSSKRFLSKRVPPWNTKHYKVLQYSR